MSMTAESFTRLKSIMLDRVSPKSRGLTSVAPKKRIPETVDNQSRKPTMIMAEKKRRSLFCIALFLLALSMYQCVDQLLTLS